MKYLGKAFAFTVFLLWSGIYNQALAFNCACDGVTLDLSAEEIEQLMVMPKSNKSATESPDQGPYIQIDDMCFAINTNRIGTKSAIANFGTPWTNGKVYYQFAPNVNETNKQRFKNACLEWANAANLTFEESIGFANYIYVQSDVVNSSYVGMKGGAQTLKMYSWNYKYIIVHEIGHALGLLHEQSRSDRDTYVDIIWSNIQGGTSNNNFNKYSTTNYGAYDFYSVMHYSRYAFALVSGTYTIVPKPEYSQYLYAMGQRSYLSELDKAGMANKYGLPNKLTFTPASLDFDAKLLGTSTELSLTIENKGTDPVSGTISIPAPFCVTSTDSYTLANSATQLVTVCYQPTEETITSTSLSFSSGESINITGQGVSNADSDGDGATNYEEYIAGTHPNIATDVFTVQPTGIDTNGIASFEITGKDGRSYQLQTTYNLVYVPFYNVGDEVIGNTGSNIVFTAPTDHRPRSYRVIVNKND